MDHPSHEDADDEAAPTMAPWMRRLRLRHLEVLTTIASAQSLTAAAQRLGVSQPSVSQWLADVEAALGVALFERGRRLRPTIYLDPVLRHAQALLDASQRLRAEIDVLRDGGTGSVRIGTMQVGAPTLVPDALVRLKRSHPALRLTVIEDIAAGLWPRFERHEVDILVTRLDAAAFARAQPCEILFRAPHCVVARRGHRLLRRRAPGWAEAARQPWILPPSGTALRRSIDATFAAQGLPPPTPWVESVAAIANPQLLLRSDALAVVSGDVARHLEASGLRVVERLGLIRDEAPVGLVWHKARPADTVSAVLEALRRAARARGARR